MENKTSQGTLAKFIKEVDNMHNSTLKVTTSGDEVLKSILKGYSKDEFSSSIHGNAETTILQGEEYLETLKKLNDQMYKLLDDDMNKLFERFARRDIPDIDASEKQSENEAIAVEPMFFHEIDHCVDFSYHEQSTFQEENFSGDETKYDEQLKFFLEYLTINKEFGDFVYIRIKREENIISYSRIDQGIELDRHEITMTRSDNLKELYETLKVSFGPDFVFGSKHSMLDGWSLLPTIGDKLMLEITSDDFADRNWISDEIHKRPPMIIDEPKKF